jgi:hypothetical protein
MERGCVMSVVKMADLIVGAAQGGGWMDAASAVSLVLRQQWAGFYLTRSRMPNGDCFLVGCPPGQSTTKKTPLPRE